MKKTLSAIAIGAFILSIVAISCKKNTDQSTPDNSNHQASFYTTSLSGLGSHGGVPSGNAFVLPTNIQLIGSMTGGLPGKSPIYEVTKTIENIPSSLPKSVYTEYGIGTYVNIYMKLFNTSYSSYKLIVPAGVIMTDSLPNDSTVVDTTQGGIIIEPDTIVFDPRDTMNICLKSFCINLHHGIPTLYNVYKFAAITNNESLHKVITILRNKKTLLDHVGDIQSILWEITDGAGLSQASIDMMNSWQ
jgi:hypothetical protein